jgi:hypothetical protein
MRRVLAIAGLAAALAACADHGSNAAWYESGDANYDAVRVAADACKAKGGEFQLKPGGDPTHLGDFECKNAKGT